tara:strand:- start:2 stop:721 length:720 start_codon:yes stop_codon:yes gene_type:complete
MKKTNEIKFSSYGVWDLLRKVYQNKEELLPKLGFKKYEEFLDWMKTGDQDTQDEFESIIKKHETEKMAPMTENILKQTIKEEIKRILSENMFKNGDIVMYKGEGWTVVSDDGFIITLKPHDKKKEIINLNYNQVKEKVRKQDDFKEGETNLNEHGAGRTAAIRGTVRMLFDSDEMTNPRLALAKALNLLDDKTAQELNFKVMEYMEDIKRPDYNSPSNTAAIKAMIDMEKEKGKRPNLD